MFWRKKPVEKPTEKIIEPMVPLSHVRTIIERHKQRTVTKPIQEFSVEEMIDEIHRRSIGMVCSVLINGEGNTPTWTTALSGDPYVRAACLTKLVDGVKAANENDVEEDDD